MARVTIEDCLKNVKNRFELVLIASKRARQLMHGKEPKVAWDNDKSTVVALREIAAGYTQFDHTHLEEIKSSTDTLDISSTPSLPTISPPAPAESSSSSDEK